MDLKTIEEVKRMEQLRYQVGLARITDTGSFQGEQGETLNYVKAEIGTLATTMIMDEVAFRKVEPFKGKFVSMEGEINIEPKKDRLYRVRFQIDRITQVK